MEDNLIFLHLPKNGGTTIHSILDRIYPRENTFTIQVIDNTRLNTDEFINLTKVERQKIKLLKGHLHFGLHNYMVGESKYITFLRRPEDRIISFYYYVLSNPKHRLYNRVKSKNFSLYDFVTSINQNDVNNAQVRFISGFNDTENNMVERAFENIQSHFSFVGFLEKFDESLILLSKIYGWGMPYYIAKNKTKKRILNSELDVKTRKAIQELNNGDNILYDKLERKFNLMLTNHKNLDYDLFKLRLFNSMYSKPFFRRVFLKTKYLLN